MAGISKKKIKLKNGKEVIKYTITYRDIFGKQHTSGLYDTIKEAKKDLNEFENINPDVKNITYGMIFQEFFQKVKSKYASNTIRNYEICYKRSLKEICKIRYDKIKSTEWQNFFFDIEKKYGPHSAHTCFKFINAAINYAIKHELIDFNILSKVERVKLPEAQTNHLTVSELKTILEECERSYPQYYALLYTFIGTGAREGEILALTKEDIDFKQKIIKINKQYTNGELKLAPKTETSKRNIYIFDELAILLQEHISNIKNNSLLFANSKGNFINPSNLRNRFWKPLLKLCGIKKKVRLHDLRGSYIDLLLSQGLSVKFAQSQVGHSKSETTLNIYAKNNQDMINSAQNILNNTFKKCENFVRIKEKPPNKKIIHFPEKSMDSSF